MLKLPHWRVTDRFPALYDTDSATAIEMVAKVYGKMNELVDEYNKFVDTLNAKIEEHETVTDTDIDVFKVAMRQEFQDFIDVVALDIKKQNFDVQDAVEYLKENLTENIQKLLDEGKINVGFVYEETEEEITLVTIPLNSANSIVYTSENEKIDVI